MSIKQNGGVFGRNPTFNDVTIDGTLTFDGDIDINSDLKIDGDLEVTGTSKLTGNVGIGIAPTAFGLSVEKDNGSGYVSTFRSNNSSPYLTIQTTGGKTQLQGINAGFTDVDAIGLQPSGGNINVGAGNFVMTSGYGIDFSATAGTGTSELFDDYEEGAFVCTINGAVEPATLITSTGYYTKIGRDVFFQVSFESVDTTGYSGTLSFSGLPFVSASTFGRSITNIIQYSGATYTGSPVGEISSNSSIVNARTDVSGAPWGVMSHNAGSGRFFWITGSYKT